MIVEPQPESLFRALSDGTRWRVLVALRRHELAVSELVEVLDQPQSTVSRHLRVLREAGLIRDRRDGRTVLYTLSPSEAGGADGSLSTQLRDWAAKQPLAPSMDARLETVIRRRREMSRRFFDQTGRHWDHLREGSFGAGFHLEAFLSLLPSEWTVVDIGTGTGFLLPALARHFRRVIALDPVQKMLEVARNRVSHYGLDNVELCEGDVAGLPIGNESADLATAVLVLHHVALPREAMGELHRILRVGGQVLIIEQATHHNEAFHDRMQDRWWGFDPKEFSGWLREAGFGDVRTNSLITTERAVDAPDLFVITGRKSS